MKTNIDILDVNSLQLQVRDDFTKFIYPYVTLRIKAVFSIWSGLFMVFLGHCTMSIPNLIDDNFRTYVIFLPFWGYIIAQVPGYILAMKCNASKLFGGCILISTLLYLVLPVTLIFVPRLAMLIRFLQGLLEGVAIVSCHSIWTSWSPQEERIAVAPLAFSGCYAGFMLGMPFCQYFSKSVAWQYSFCYIAFVGIAWFIVWRPSILEKPTKNVVNGEEITLLYSTNWQICSMFLPIWVICITFFCVLTIFQAHFLKDHASLTVEMSILFGLIPNLTMCVPIEGIITGYVKKSGQVFNSQRVFYSSVLGTEAIFLFISIAVKNMELATLALVIGSLFSGPIMSGFYFNNLSANPTYVTIMMGLSNVIRFISCLLVLQYHEGQNTEFLGQWRIAVILLGTLYLSMVVVYAIVVNTGKRSWSYARLHEDNTLDDVEESDTGKKSLLFMIHI